MTMTISAETAATWVAGTTGPEIGPPLQTKSARSGLRGGRKTESGYAYRNKSGHAGYETPPGLASEPGKTLSPMALDELLRSRVWHDYIYRDTDYSWQTSLMEPVGGMDNSSRAS